MTKTGGGYWLVASDGGVFSYGDARFSGSTGAIQLAKPIVGVAADPDGTGYWFVASDGGVFSFDAPFYGSAAGALPANETVVGIAASGAGYWLATSTGRVLSYGAAGSFGDAGTTGRAFVGIASRHDGRGYWLLAQHATSAATQPPASERRRLAFGAQGQGVWTVNDDGTDLRQAAKSGDSPRWSPDGRTLSWERSGGVVLRDEATGAERTIDECEFHVWSPSGSRIACDNGFDNGNDIIVISTTDFSRVSFGVGSSVVWSPDGSRIAYGRLVNGDWDIVNVAVDGSDAIDVTPMAGSQTDPVWSPDGESIAFQGERFQGHPFGDIFVAPSRGGTPVNISNNPNDNYIGPDARAQAWSDAGLLFNRNINDTNDLPDYWVTAYRPGRPNAQLARGSGGVWSSDTQQIALWSGDTVYVMNGDGSGRHAVSPSSLNASGVQWRP